jgi:hypothetical protein
MCSLKNNNNFQKYQNKARQVAHNCYLSSSGGLQFQASSSKKTVRPISMLGGVYLPSQLLQLFRRWK